MTKTVSTLAIWQIYYNQLSRDTLDKGFIPYDNTDKLTLFFENEAIIDVHNKYRNIWNKADYVGVLSWRLKEKTNLTHHIISNHINNADKKADIYNLMPSMYDSFHSAYSIYGYKPTQAICKIIDSKRLFPFSLYGHDSLDRFKNFCNYFVCKPEIFDDFVVNYLGKLFTWLQTCNDNDLLVALRTMVFHRNQPYPIHTFLLEGLFECYVIYKGYSYDRILVDESVNNIEEIKNENFVLIKKALNAI